MTAADAAEARLIALVARQRRELDRMRAQAAARSVIDTAQGMLMERFGCSAADAGHQLARLAHESGIPLADLAADLTGQQFAPRPEEGLPGSQPAAPAGTGPAGTGPAGTGPAGTGPAGSQPGAAGSPATADARGTGHAPATADAQGSGDAPGAAGWGTDGAPGGEGTAWRGLSMARAAFQVAPEGDSIAAAALEHVLAPAGACAVGLWLASPDGSLELAGQAGLGMAVAARWRHIPGAMDCSLRRVARTGTSLLWPAGRPESDAAPVVGPWPDGARAALPLPGPGMTLGVMEACWPGPLGDFDPPLRRQLSVLADLCAHALRPGAASGHPAAWLYGLLDAAIESAFVARPVRGEDGGVTDFRICHVSGDFRDPAGRRPADLAGQSLLEAYPVTARAGGLFDLAVRVVTTGEPEHVAGGLPGTPDAGAVPADIRVAPLFDGVVITWRRADEAERLASLLQHAERLGRIGGWEEDLLTGGIRWSESACALFGRPPGAAIGLADLHAHVLEADVADVKQFRGRLLAEQKATAAVFRIVRADDDSVRQIRVFAEPVIDPAGVVAAVRGAFQDVSAVYHTQVALSATRDRLADTEERAAEEHRLAMRLQQAITPSAPQPVAAAGLDVAARYRPAGPGHLVSGDWYDTVLLPTRQVLLVVGDIAGHGIDAVTGMVELRNSLRGLAITGAGPANLLGWLNEVACELTGGTIGTAVCGLYDPVGRTLRWSRAGHLPPVLVRGGRARALPSADALLLGADPGVQYEEVTTALRSGDALLLFTDGLIERRGEPIDEALASLLRVASRPVGAVAAYADHLMRHAASDTGDDACLVAVHVR